MAIKQTYHWIRTVGGYCALVEAEDRDRLTPLGWQEVTEPAPGDFVYMRKDGIDVPGAFTYSGLTVWQDAGWVPGPPPQHVDLTKDPAPPVARAEKPTKSKPAAGADENPKE